MKRTDYNSRVARTIRALRKLRGLKQEQLAEVLCIERSAYSKLENGETAINVDCLKIISEILKTSVFQILVIAEVDILINFQLTSLSDILIRYTLLIEGKDSESNFSKDELEYIIAKIKSQYNSGKTEHENLS